MFLTGLLSVTIRIIKNDGGLKAVDKKQMIGARIKEIRNKKGLTQEQLSEKMEINPKYLSSIERG